MQPFKSGWNPPIAVKQCNLFPPLRLVPPWFSSPDELSQSFESGSENEGVTRYSFPKLSVSTFFLFFVDSDETELVFERESLWSRPLLFAGHFDIICCIKSHTFRPRIQPLPFPSHGQGLWTFISCIISHNLTFFLFLHFFFGGGGGEQGLGRRWEGAGSLKEMGKERDWRGIAN